MSRQVLRQMPQIRALLTLKLHFWKKKQTNQKQLHKTSNIQHNSYINNSEKCSLFSNWTSLSTSSCHYIHQMFKTYKEYFILYGMVILTRLKGPTYKTITQQGGLNVSSFKASSFAIKASFIPQFIFNLHGFFYWCQVFWKGFNKLVSVTSISVVMKSKTNCSSWTSGPMQR